MSNLFYRTNQRGAAMLLFIVFFLFGSMALALGLIRSIYSELYQVRLLEQSTQSYYAAESGVEDMAYRFITGLGVDATETITVQAATAVTSFTYDSADDRFDIQSDADLRNLDRSSALSLYTGTGASFNFGVQSGNGGFEMSNGSKVYGNVFSNGKIEKVGGGTATIYGDAISADSTGLIKNINATGTARAHTLSGNYIEGDAYYTTDSASVVLGTRYTPSADQATATMPISDSKIADLEQDVIDTGTIIAATDPECLSGEYFIDTDTTLGNVKVECNLRIKKQGAATTLTLTGTLWVAGNIIFEAGPTVQIDAAVGNRTVAVIADNPADTITSSQIEIQSGTEFYGSGNPKSYVLLISQNDDAENGGGTEDAIFVGQSSLGDLLVYASHGQVRLGNSIGLKEVTGYKIVLGNSAEVVYESGLVNLLFTSGPGGGFTIGSWREVP